MKKEKKTVFLIVSCLMALSLLVLQSPTAVKGAQNCPNSPPPILPEFQSSSPLYPTIPIRPWPPTGQCPSFWHGFTSDPIDMGFPLPQGNCLDGEWRDAPMTVTEVFIPMRDGVKLAANVYRPGKPGKYPVIMTFTPYGKDLFGTAKTWGVDSFRNSDHTTFEGPDPGFFVPEGYVVVVADNRGYDKSGGCRLGFGTGEDFYDGIEWAGTQEWSNGNVGMIGVSALGMCQWYGAQLHPPHLKAIAPWEATSLLPTPLFGGLTNWQFYATIAGLSSPPYPDQASCIGVAPLPSTLVLENITVPMLACVSSSDQLVHTRGTEWGWKMASSKQKWLYNHGGQKWGRYYGADGQAVQLMFFNHFLKGTDDRILDMPRVRYEVRDTLDEFYIRYADDWPIPETEYTALYLDATTGTSFSAARALSLKAVKHTGKISYDSTVTEVAIADNSSFNHTRYEPSVQHETLSTVAPGRAIFDYRFDQDTELTGHMALKVWVSADSSDDMALFVTVKKLDLNGNEVFFDCSDSNRRLPVALGWLRLSERALNPQLSTPWQPIQSLQVQPVSPGQIVPAEIEIVVSSTLFHAGETLRLIISGDTQTYSTRHHFVHFNYGNCSIYTGGQYDSYLLIPVIPPQKGKAAHHHFLWHNDLQEKGWDK